MERMCEKCHLVGTKPWWSMPGNPALRRLRKRTVKAFSLGYTVSSRIAWAAETLSQTHKQDQKQRDSKLNI